MILMISEGSRNSTNIWLAKFILNIVCANVEKRERAHKQTQQANKQNKKKKLNGQQKSGNQPPKMNKHLRQSSTA